MLKGTSPKAAPESATTTPDSRAAFLHFITNDGREFGFPFSQLLHFVLEPTSGSAAPPQRLLLAFPSHDVTLIGYRLHRLCEWLDEQKAVRLKAEDARFANLHGNQRLWPALLSPRPRPRDHLDTASGHVRAFASLNAIEEVACLAIAIVALDV